MASISKDRNGLKRLLIVLPDGSRRPIRLGKMSSRHADTVRCHVEELVASKICRRSCSDETSRWLASADVRLINKLARLGLTNVRKSVTLKELVDGWLDRNKARLKPGTSIRYQQGKRSLLAYFSADRDITTITEGEVEDFRAALLAEGLAEATVRKRCSDARIWLRYAVKHGYIRNNPFAAVPTGAIATKDLAVITEADACKVLDQIGNPDLKLIFALARWGGLRTVSEPKALTWDCILWDKSRIVVKSPKTERYEGQDQRIIPLFPELAGLLQGAFDRASEGEVYVLPCLQKISSAALRKPIQKAITAAGVTPWKRLWQNLRASRQTELEGCFPSHVVCAWMGNSPRVARKHYLQIRECDFDKAVAGVLGKAAQNAAQKVSETGRNRQKMDAADGPENAPNVEKPAENTLLATCSSDPDGI